MSDPVTFGILCRGLFIFTLVSVSITPEFKLLAQEIGDARQRDRYEFFEAFSKLKPSMPSAKVEELIGKPDDVLTHRDPEGISNVKTKEIWHYGTNGHLTTPTLGRVYIDKQDRIQSLWGASGKLPPRGMFTESEIRHLLRVLDDIPTYNSGWDFDPTQLIHAVNTLQPLGKQKALAAIQEHLRVGGAGEGVFLVLRVLFDVPKRTGHMPRMAVGAPSVANHKDLKILPRFPIVLIGDVPLLLSEGFNISGMPQQAESHVDYFSEHGTVRSGPLKPSPVPLQHLKQFVDSPRWPYVDDGLRSDSIRGEHFLREQMLTAMDTVYPVEKNARGHRLAFGRDQQKVHDKIIEQAGKLQIKWDPQRFCYTFADGSFKPRVVPRPYFRKSWIPKIDGLDLKITVQRDGPKAVNVWVEEHYIIGRDRPTGELRVFEVNQEEHTLQTFSVGGIRPREKWFRDRIMEHSRGQTGGGATWRPVLLDDGLTLKLELTVGDKILTSPEIKP